MLGQAKSSYNGDVILSNQKLASQEGFKNVSKIWYDKCIPLDEGMHRMAQSQATISDLVCPLSSFEGVVENGRYGWKYKPTGRVYRPTEKALNDMAILGGASTWAAQALAGNMKDNAIKRDYRDAEVLKDYINIHLFATDRCDTAKERLFRTWDDGTLRACLSTQYIIINNVWVLEQIKKMIPGGMLSHWRSNPDELRGNVLIPDTIREETDSDYGGMLSVGNSEIGTGRIYSRPSVFRAICMNGCIWDQEMGKAINKVHRGKNFDLAAMGELIRDNLQKQIPLLTTGVDKILTLKAYDASSLNPLQMIAQAAIDYKIGPKDISKVVRGYNMEHDILGNVVKTAFGLQAAITRAGQLLDNDEWVRYDEIAGAIMSLTPSEWDGFVRSANKIDDKVLEKVGLAV